MKNSIFCCFFLLLTFIGKSQVRVIPDSLAGKKYFAVDKTMVDKAVLETFLRERLDSLKSVGYLAASVDSILQKNDELSVHLYLGKRVPKVKISNGSIDVDLFQRTVSGSLMDWERAEQIRKEIHEDYLEQGFLKSETSFAVKDASLDIIELELNIDKGDKYKLDQLIPKGDVKINLTYLKDLFQLNESQIITKSILEKIEKTSAGSSFFELSSPPSLHFKQGGFVDVYLDMKAKKANQFDLLLGFLPNPLGVSSTSSKNNFLITGEGILKLVNPFGAGREFFVEYKQLQRQSPILDASFYLPRILKQPFGAVGSFNLEKKDTSFVSLTFDAGLDYQFGGNQHLRITYEGMNSYLQKVDTTLIKQTRALPALSDYNLSLYSLGYSTTTLNSAIAPTKGLEIDSKIGVGTRTIKKNASIIGLSDSTFNYDSLYAGINEDKLAIKGEAQVSYFIPFQKNSTFLLKNASGYKHLGRFFENDLYRLGGLKTIRGFDERSYLASLFSISTLEYRLLLNRESYFSVFSDLGYTKNEYSKKNDFLTGLGTGLNLGTKAGQFSINVAVGKDKENPFDFNRTRLHFGYVNTFK